MTTNTSTQANASWIKKPQDIANGNSITNRLSRVTQMKKLVVEYLDDNHVLRPMPPAEQ